MNFLFFVLMLIVQASIGYNILQLLKIRLHRFSQLSLSMVLGIGIISLIPFTLEMLHIPLTKNIIFTVIIILFLLLIFINHKHYRNIKINIAAPNLKIYETPWIAIIGIMFFISFYFSILIPPVPRDLLSGPEPIAHFALTEHTFINSVFKIEMPFNNGPFKSLYIPSLQLIYKLLGFSFGKIWMPVLSFSFVVFLYSEIRAIVNPLLASFLILLLMFCTELYGYTYLVLYDYSNMIFFVSSLFFLHKYLFKDELKYVWLSSLLMGIATYVRPETLILATFICGYAFIHKIFAKKYSLKQLLPIFTIGATSAIFYFFSSYVYLNYYLPVFYDVEGMVNTDITNITPLFERLWNITNILIFSQRGITYYNYFFYVFSALLIAELIVYRKLNQNARFWLGIFFTSFFAIAFMGFLLPLADLTNTTKRALFKVLPIALLYLANNQLFLTLSNKIQVYLQGKKTSVANPPKPKARQKKARA